MAKFAVAQAPANATNNLKPRIIVLTDIAPIAVKNLIRFESRSLGIADFIKFFTAFKMTIFLMFRGIDVGPDVSFRTNVFLFYKFNKPVSFRTMHLQIFAALKHL